MKYITAFAIGFTAVLLLFGLGNIISAVEIWIWEHLTRDQFMLGCAVAGGIVGVVLLRWINPPKKL